MEKLNSKAAAQPHILLVDDDPGAIQLMGGRMHAGRGARNGALARSCHPRDDFARAAKRLQYTLVTGRTVHFGESAQPAQSMIGERRPQVTPEQVQATVCTMTFENHAISRSIVKLRAVVPENAFTAGILGSERVGNGIVINSDGLILTIGYLITEATDVWLTVTNGHEVAGHALAYDQVTGFGLVLPLEKPGVAPLELGSSAGIHVGDEAHVFSFPEFSTEQTVHVVARREFAGAWEYLLDGAIFTAPAHPHWSGSALVDDDGLLVGLGSLLVRETVAGEETNANMFVPIDLLKPILNDLMTRGRADRQSRPWLGVYAVEVTGRVYVTGVAEGSPAQSADIREGDLIRQVGDQEVTTLSEFYRHLWSLGPAGVGVPLTTVRGGTSLHVIVRSADRTDLLKRPQPH